MDGVGAKGSKGPAQVPRVHPKVSQHGRRADLIAVIRAPSDGNNVKVIISNSCAVASVHSADGL